MKILAVEDEFVSRVKLQKILGLLGECHMAVNGQEAIDAFEEAQQQNKPYDLITVDVKLPDMDGLEIVRRIRRMEREHMTDEHYHEAKILMITAHSGKNVMTSFKEGVEGYIVKPFNSHKIATELTRIGLKPFTSND